MYYLKSFSALAFISLISFLAVSKLLAQQQFNLIIGSDSVDAALSCTINNDNSITIGGHTNSFQVQSYDLYLLKLSEQGNIIWNKTYGNYGMDGIREIKRTNDNGYVLGGYSGSGDYWDFLVMKVDSLGNPSWAKSIGGFYPDECLSVSQTSDNGFIAAGHTKSYGSYPTGWFSNYYLVKYSPTGQIEWNKIIGWDYHDWAHYVTQTKDKGYAILGYSDLGYYYVDYDIVIAKTDSLGNLLWANAYALDGHEYAFEFKEIPDSGFVIAGYTLNQNIFLIRTNSQGNVIWSKRFVGAQNCYAYSLNINMDGGFIIGGQVGSDNPDALIIRTDKDGNLVWARKYAGHGSESFGDVKQLSNSGFLAVGNTTSVGDFSVNIFAIKTDSTGQSVCPSSIVNLTTQPFTPNSYRFNGFQSISAGTTSDWNYTIKNPSPKTYASCIIPVELRTFEYHINKNIVELKWSTATELNNQRFEIYRDYVLIGFREGNGTSSIQHDYSFSDEPPHTGKYIYTLLQVDYDGSRNEIGKLEVDFNQIPIKYELAQNYPNPFNPTTKINFALAKSGLVTLKVYDLLGREIETLVNEEKDAGYYGVNFDGSKLSSGTYIYTLKTADFRDSKKLLLIK